MVLFPDQKVALSDYVRTRPPTPVQILVDWTTTGKPNSKALGLARDDIVAVANESGLFCINL